VKEFLLLQTFLESLPMDANAEAIFFGGSFNPWHAGHAECLRLAPKHIAKIVLPDQNPLKASNQQEQDLNLIAEEISKVPNTYLFTAFADMPTKNPTYDWLSYLSQTTHYKLSLLIGMDNFLHFNQWYKYNEILNLTHFIYIVSRLESVEQKDQALQKLNHYPLENKFKFLGHHAFEDLSSTQLRKNSPT
jgi:nicotinate-nucleotide adenylyltransferase